MLESPQFARSHRLQRFLGFIVERKLAGRDNEIQEYTIGLEVFDRRESFDPRCDSIVRVEARRLRDRLADYYAKEGRTAPVRIVLAERGYVPSFEERRDARSWTIHAAIAAVACALVIVLFYGLAGAPSRHEPAPPAREAFEKGLAAWHQWTGEGARQAQQFFEQAVAYDPEYARAYAWLSAAYRQQATMGDAAPHDVYTKSLQAAEKAISLDPQLAEGYQSLATNLTFKPDWIGAERAFRTAIQLDPDSSGIHHGFGIVLLAASSERLAEAEAELRRAVTLKPGDLGNRVVLAKVLYFRRRFPEARSMLEEVLKIDPYYPDAMRNLAAVLLQSGDAGDAVRLYEQAQKLAYLAWGDGLLGHALALGGKEERARSILAGREADYAAKPVGALAIGTIYAGLREWAPACQWLDRAWTNREIRTRYINVDPIYAPMREQACFARVLEKIQLSSLTTRSH
ncbi:MAG: tetratricopeptide repeat protein [Acidobacteria bacterium]|nr:tetratricopeptide repeat protein [Acidobacteriota bacterium]